MTPCVNLAFDGSNSADYEPDKRRQFNAASVYIFVWEFP